MEHEREQKRLLKVTGQHGDGFRDLFIIRSLFLAKLGIDPEEDGATGPALPWRAGDPLDPVVIGTMKKAVDDGIPSPTMEEFIASEEALAERVAMMESAR